METGTSRGRQQCLGYLRAFFSQKAAKAERGLLGAAERARERPGLAGVKEREGVEGRIWAQGTENLLVNLGLFAAGVWVARNLTDIDLMAPQPGP
uniref:Uncharacterized protein n=1 Tax=Strix occidentalis caurina TaxID=311401 RepID=A0A8D0KSF5_STROC